MSALRERGYGVGEIWAQTYPCKLFVNPLLGYRARRRPNGVRNPVDSRFRANDGGEIKERRRDNRPC